MSSDWINFRKTTEQSVLTNKYHWLIEAHTFISLVESYSTVIKKTSSTFFLRIDFFLNRLKIWKTVRKKRILNFVLVYISSISVWKNSKLELQTVDSVQKLILCKRFCATLWLIYPQFLSKSLLQLPQSYWISRHTMISKSISRFWNIIHSFHIKFFRTNPIWQFIFSPKHCKLPEHELVLSCVVAELFNQPVVTGNDSSLTLHTPAYNQTASNTVILLIKEAFASLVQTRLVLEGKTYDARVPPAAIYDWFWQ